MKNLKDSEENLNRNIFGKGKFTDKYYIDYNQFGIFQKRPIIKLQKSEFSLTDSAYNITNDK